MNDSNPEAPTPPNRPEHYPKDWALVCVMVSPLGTIHAIGGDRAPGDPSADLPYIGLERIDAKFVSVATDLSTALNQLRQAREELNSIHTTAHCISKAGPLNTPTLQDAWRKFDLIAVMATNALTTSAPKEKP